MIGGTGSQLIDWPDEFCNELVVKNYRVILFDNRDAGLSTKFDSAGEPNWPVIIDSLTHGKKPPLAYTVEDMANDVIGLLDALQIKKANLIGASMGGIIAQIIATKYPDRVKSLTIFMSTTGNPSLPPMKPEIQSLILSNPPAAAGDTIAIVKRQMKLMKDIGSPWLSDK